MAGTDKKTFELSDEGGLIWQLSDGATTAQDIAQELAQRTSVEVAGVEEDVVDFVDELVEEGLMEWADHPGQPSSDWTNRIPGTAHFDPETYDGFIREDVPGYERLHEAVAGESASEPASTIVDLGSGTGEAARRILARQRDAHVTAVDASEEMLAAARLRLPPTRASFRVGLLPEAMPEGPFDLAVSVLALHRLPDDAKRELFERVRASLVPNGRFIVGDAVASRDPGVATVAFYPEYDHPATLEDLVAWLCEARFEVDVPWQERDLVVLVAR
jgi:tRNA (cmo5U34)-methyltransferase